MHESELINIYGGADVLTSSIINTFIRGISLVLEIGRTVGSTVRRLIDDDYACKKEADE